MIAVNRQSLDDTLALVADDCTYHNVPTGTVQGQEAMRRALEPMFAGGPVTFETTQQICVGNVVMNERIDTFTTGGTTVVLPVAGVFEVTDGKISLWRDYWDLQTIAKAKGA